MLSLCRFLAQHSEVLAAELVECTARCWLFGGATGASAWSLDAMITTAYLCFFGGMQVVSFYRIDCGSSEDNKLMSDAGALWGWLPPLSILMFIVGGQHVCAKYDIRYVIAVFTKPYHL